MHIYVAVDLRHICSKLHEARAAGSEVAFQGKSLRTRLILFFPLLSSPLLSYCSFSSSSSSSFSLLIQVLMYPRLA